MTHSVYVVSLVVGLLAYLPSTEITVGSEKATACVVVSTLTDALVCLGRLKMLDGKMQDTDRFTTTTLVPASNVQSREDELNNVAHWARANNLKLNRAKSVEIIITDNRCRVQEPRPSVLPRI